MAWETSVLYDFSSSTGWTADPFSNGASGITITGGQALGGNADFESWHSTTFGPDGDYEMVITVVTPPATGGYVILYAIQTRDATPDTYRVTLVPGNGANTLRLTKDTGGTGSTLVASSQAVSAGNKIGMRRKGTTMKLGYYNGTSWAQIGTDVTDSSYEGAYLPGLYLWSNTGSNTVVDDLCIGVIPDAPTHNAPTPGNTQVSLAWTSVSGATGYKVLRGTATGVYGTEIDAGNVTSYVNTGLSNGTQYFYVIRAYNGTNTHSDNSGEQNATPTGGGAITSRLALMGVG